jgi:hypothetical protein
MQVYSRSLANLAATLLGVEDRCRRSRQLGSTTAFRWRLFRGFFCGIATSGLSRGRKQHHTFHLVLEALGLGASSNAVLALDLLVVVDEHGEQFLAEYSRLLRLKHLQYHDFIAECYGVARVGMKQIDRVANETVDVRNLLGGHVGGWLVVGRVDGGNSLSKSESMVRFLPGTICKRCIAW